MDLKDNTLLNEHGYASQEMVNLMIVGQAKSNLHDGDQDLGDNYILKGIPHRPDIGFLSFFEYFEYFTVGECYKSPKLPIWVVCSESHYSVLFSLDIDAMDVKKGKTFDLVYYDELARQEDDIILSITPGVQKCLGPDENKHPVPIDEVVRTKWPSSKINWNGRTQIL